MSDDDKPRRNLLIASAAIALGAWLDLPSGTVIGRILGTPDSQVSNWKVWVAVLVVLAFLTHRYWHTSRGEWRMGYDQIRIRREQLTRKLLEAELKRGKPYRALHQLLADVESARANRNIGAALPNSIVLPGGGEQQAAFPKGRLPVILNWPNAEAFGIDTEYVVPHLSVVIFHVRSAVRVIFWSEYTTQLLIPFGLWLFAVAFAEVRLIDALP